MAGPSTAAAGEPLMARRVVRLRDGDGRVRAGVADGALVDVFDRDDPLALLAADGLPEPIAQVEALDAQTLDLPQPWRLLAPLAPPETWAAGVTYERSRQARVAESQIESAYDLVYEAQRPELFLKDAAARRTVGPRDAVAVRGDASWTVPEPELALVLGADGELLAATIGNDVSSRDIEGANPLYLPQAKVYAGACALGPALLVPDDWSVPFEIELVVRDAAGAVVFEDRTSTASMRRSFAELVGYLRRDNPLAPGTVLLTGTGIVPPDDASLQPGQTVAIHVPGIGTLVNAVAHASTIVGGRV
jgi:2-dehydro-3-deoxy-D-arabinonate dehydratase